jgi:hypothetical protein
MNTRVGLGSIAAVALASCGGGSSGPTLENASACEAAWTALTPARPYDITSSLVYHAGAIYYTTYASATYPTGAVMAQPTAGGAPTAIATTMFGRELWLDGDQLIIAGGDLGTQFYGVPTTGGTPSLLLDGADGRTDAGGAMAYAITPTELFWLEIGLKTVSGPTTAWHAQRTGGTAAAIGSASAVYPNGDVLAFQNMAVASDAVLMAEGLGIADAIPLDGSPVRALATSDDLMRARGDFAGIDPAGVYWTVPRAGARPEDDTWSVSLAPADGGPLRPFWDGTPAHSAVFKLWPDGNGGWVAIAGQLFDDLRQHITVWTIDANGQGRRLACSPTDGTSMPNIQDAPAIAPDAIYLEDSGSKFQIVRIAR